MPVHIIIDGYNLIRQSPSLSVLDGEDIQLGRDALLEQLSAYKRVKGHAITVVFDGAEANPLFQKRDSVRGIAVRFSRAGELADNVIKRMAAHEKEKALVVSSDREIVHFAEAQGSAVISSPEFDQKLAMVAYLDVKGIEDEAAENTGWSPTTKKKGPHRRLSKKARRNQAKIKKL